MGASTVDVVDYSPEWPRMFEVARQELARVLGDAALRIEHIGSTSVQGLVAKPTIDVAIGVTSLDEVRNHGTELEELGYEIRGGFHDAHVMVRRVVDGERTHHLHFIVYPSHEFDDWILFRDLLREDPGSRSEYARVKLELAQRFSTDRGSYVEAKTEVVERLVRRARERYRLPE